MLRIREKEKDNDEEEQGDNEGSKDRYKEVERIQQGRERGRD